MSLLYDRLFPALGHNSFYIDDKELKEYGQLFIVDHIISEPVLKTSKIDFDGIHGSIDTTYSVFPEPRYQDRYVEIYFKTMSDTREEALETIRAIDMLLGQEVRLRKSLASPYYFSGRMEKGVDYTQRSKGVFDCKLEFKVFPLSMQNFDSNYLWDDISFETYYFNDYGNSVPALGQKIISFNIPAPAPNELVVYSSTNKIDISYMNGSEAFAIRLSKDINYLPLVSTGGPLSITMQNIGAEEATVNISLTLGRLEYV